MEISNKKCFYAGITILIIGFILGKILDTIFGCDLKMMVPSATTIIAGMMILIGF